jgi:hypothetical protein
VEGGHALPPVLKTIAKRENGTNMRPAILLFAVALASIHPSAWNRDSANFAFWGFSEVRIHGVLRSSHSPGPAKLQRVTGSVAVIGSQHQELWILAAPRCPKPSSAPILAADA